MIMNKSRDLKQIDIVVKYFYPVAAGIETNIYETHKYFLKKGWKVIVHTSKNTLIEKNVLPGKDIYNGITIVRYPYDRLGFFPKID